MFVKISQDTTRHRKNDKINLVKIIKINIIS